MKPIEQENDIPGFTALLMKTAVFWEKTSYGLVYVSNEIAASNFRQVQVVKSTIRVLHLRGK
jgi:hypothetical protein